MVSKKGYEQGFHRDLSTNKIATRLLTVSPSMHCTGGCLLQGGAWSQGVCLVLRGGVPAPGGEGVCSGGVVSQHALR